MQKEGQSHSVVCDTGRGDGGRVMPRTRKNTKETLEGQAETRRCTGKEEGE